ncbi:MAG: hypothetical protein NHB15_07485 [Methanosarcina barkeri]|nr:hypothetical protein [Methanosarcina sp. ERenArc_MAG2]
MISGSSEVFKEISIKNRYDSSAGIDEEETVKALEMIDLRIKSEHAYQEETVDEIYRQVGDYWKLMDKVFRRVVEKAGLGFR